jgi:hypothetical protein
MNIDLPNRFKPYTVAASWLCLATLASGCSLNAKTGLHSSGGTTASGGTMAQGGSAVSGGSADQRGNGGMAGAGGASSSSSGVSCYDSSGAIATTAKTCTLAGDCVQVVQPTLNCCGAISVVGLAKSSSCTFPTPSCENVSCPIFTNPAAQAEDGQDTGQGGTIGVQCVGGQCMTFVMAGGADAAADATGGATSAGGGAGSGGTQAAGGATGTGGSTSTSDGSVSTADLDTCSSDADCTSCNWGGAPTDSSQCTGTYCCGGRIMSKKRCDANQAAWATYCPGQSPTLGNCACVGCTGQSIGCVGGQCGLWCHFPDAG